jgi:hypothetical protein
MTWKTRAGLALGALLFLAGVTFAAGSEVARIERRDTPPVVFVCRNGVAMSVWSAAYFNRLAAERGLSERAVARAALPSFTAVPLSMRLALALDGFRIGDFRPRVMADEDARSAALVVAIDTELPGVVTALGPPLERWSGFPPMREQYFPSRAALMTRVEALVERLAQQPLEEK